MGHHDMRCKFAYTIGRHNTVQHALQNQLREAGLNVDRATVHELRSSPGDRSQKQADLLVRGLPGGTAETLIDVGVRHSLIGTHINLNKPEKSRIVQDYHARVVYWRFGHFTLGVYFF